MGQSTTAARRLIRLEREAQAIELRKSGMSYPKIAAALGISVSGTAKIVRKVMARLRHVTDEKAEQLRQFDLDRLDTMLNGVWDNATAGNVNAIECVLKIMTRRARLLGLDAPTKQEITGRDGAAIEITDARERLTGTVARIADAIAEAENPSGADEPTVQ